MYYIYTYMEANFLLKNNILWNTLNLRPTEFTNPNIGPGDKNYK